MADKEKETAEGEQAGGEKQPKAKGPIKLLGAVFGMIVLGGSLAFMAIPSKDTEPRFQGPFHFKIFEDKINTNLKDNENRRYLQMTLDCMFFGYDESYASGRTTDPLYEPMLLDAVGKYTSSRSLSDTYEGPAREAFLEGLRAELDPILFPVHIGDTEQPLAADENSGIRAGISFRSATFRGRFHDHILKVDGVGKTVQLDDGPPMPYLGGEEDLKVTTLDGESLYLDIAELDDEFSGEVRVGTKGTIRQLLTKEFIAQ